MIVDGSKPLAWPEDYINQVICGDCLEVMKGIPDGAVDLVVTDPPYGIGFTQRTTGKKIIGDDVPFSPRIFDRFDCIKVLWGANHYQDSLPEGSWLIWVKRAVEVASQKKSYADAEMGWITKHQPVRVIRHISDGCIRQGEEHGIVRLHPAQKPIRVMRWSILQAGEGEIILDPFLGSGTTAVAAKQLGRKFIGIEINMDYCKKAEDRLRQEVLDL